MPRPLATAFCALALAAACTPEPRLPQAPPAQTLAGEIALRPPRAAEGACWAHQIRPAVIETVTEQVQLRPEQRDPVTGAVTRAATFRTETRQQIVSDQTPIWFRTPCDEQMTPEFIASLQRALRARGLYRGPAGGELDPATIRALGAYQAPRGLPSGTLALATAQELGLIAWQPPR
ncbi:MAG: peptidoglycan-binding protein [Rhodobacteraceae bacterium]|nr:peptidoglycan-binding protein [Paracoccaceae bacterium]